MDSNFLWTPPGGPNVQSTRDPLVTGLPCLLLQSEEGTELLVPNQQRWVNVGQQGVTLGDSNRPSRVLLLTVAILADTYDSRDAFRGVLAAAFNPFGATGPRLAVMTWTRRDGVVRVLQKCQVTRGLVGLTRTGAGSNIRTVLEIEALDPYWYSADLATRYDSLYTNAVAP